MFSTKSIAAAVLSALALTGACATTAAADSILYLKGGDVWLSEPDGSRQFQVTTTGGYKSASQSDDGTIVALKGQRIHRLDRFGEVLSDISTAVSDGEADDKVPYVSHFVGPHEVDLSPDGRKVAYNWHWQYWTTFGGGWTGYHMLRQGVSVSALDHTTGWDEPGMGYQTGWVDSSWYDDDTLVYGGKASAGMMDISFNDVGRSNVGSTDWFHHPMLKDMRQPAVSPQRDKIVVVGDSNNEWSTGQQLWIWQSTGDAPALPTICNAFGNANGDTYASPTFSPDGKMLAWEEGDGIYTVSSVCKEDVTAKRVIPGGTEPDWSAADVPASRPVKQQPQQQQPQPNMGGNTGTQTVPKGKETVLPDTMVPGADDRPSTVRDDAAKPALTLSFACRSACTVSGKVIAPKKVARKLGLGRGALATGEVRRSDKGSAKLELRLTAQGQRALARVHGRKLSLQVSIKEGARTRKLTKRVVLR